MSQLSDKVLIFRYFWATCPHSDELPATFRLIFYKKCSERMQPKTPLFPEISMAGGDERPLICQKSQIFGISGTLWPTTMVLFLNSRWWNPRKIWKYRKYWKMLGNLPKMTPFWYFWWTFGHSDELPANFAVIFIKKSLSLEPSKNHVVLGIRVYFFCRTSADRMLVSVTNMGGRGHIYIYMCI